MKYNYYSDRAILADRKWREKQLKLDKRLNDIKDALRQNTKAIPYVEKMLGITK